MPTEKQRISGLYKRGEIWHIDKKIMGKRIVASTGSKDYEDALRLLFQREREIRDSINYGLRPKRKFGEAMIKYLKECQKPIDQLKSDALFLRRVSRWVGDLNLDHVNMGALQPYIQHEKKRGVKNRTVNSGIQIVRRVLNLAASEWYDSNGMTWLAYAPKIKLLPEIDRRDPYPISFTEQARLFNELPEHLRNMALFKVNTGCREAEVCKLRWDEEILVEELHTSVFLIDRSKVKNRQDRLVVLNRYAREVIERQRGLHPEYVFPYRGHPVKKMYGTAWKMARKRVSLVQVRVHDLKHTFGRRLRAAGVDHETRQDLLGHKNRNVTSHYSAIEIDKLLRASELVCVGESRKSPTLTVLRKKIASSAGR